MACALNPWTAPESREVPELELSQMGSVSFRLPTLESLCCTHVEDTFAVVDQSEELCRHYNAFRPVRNPFTLSTGKEPEQDTTQRNTVEQRGNTKKRKRAPYVPNEREGEARQRHEALAPHLRNSVAAFKGWLDLRAAARAVVSTRAKEMPDDGLGFKKQKPPASDLQAQPGDGLSSAEKEADAAVSPTKSSHRSLAADEEEPLDFVSLAELKSVLKPKFCFGGQAVNLFDCVIENDSDEDRVGAAHTAEVLIPARSRFLLSDMANFRKLLPGDSERGFDCIVMDPPWENKSAKRAAKYPTVPSRRLLCIPVPQLLNKETGGLLVLWMTNREKLHRFVEEELLPAWNLQLRAIWTWLKVDASGKLVGPLEVAHRRPYEALLLAAPPHWQPQNGTVPARYSIFAVPAEHSRKPHLGRLLAKYLPSRPKCLELFARELACGWTSAGNDTLAFQRLGMFKKL